MDVEGHAVLAVGYKIIQDQLYYILQSSWGVAWGKDGFVFVPANTAEAYGLFDTVYFPIVNEQVCIY